MTWWQIVLLVIMLGWTLFWMIRNAIIRNRSGCCGGSSKSCDCDDDKK